MRHRNTLVLESLSLARKMVIEWPFDCRKITLSSMPMLWLLHTPLTMTNYSMMSPSWQIYILARRASSSCSSLLCWLMKLS